MLIALVDGYPTGSSMEMAGVKNKKGEFGIIVKKLPEGRCFPSGTSQRTIIYKIVHVRCHIRDCNFLGFFGVLRNQLLGSK